MTRMRHIGICPDCKELAKVNDDGAVACRCPNKMWYRPFGVEGTEQEAAHLKLHGFEPARDIEGDYYYCGPMGHIIWLCADGTWHAERGDPSWSLQEYLDRVCVLAVASASV